MAQTTLRIPDELLERIDDATDSETSRSEWLREAARRRLEKEQDADERLEELEERLACLEEEQQRPFYWRLFGK